MAEYIEREAAIKELMNDTPEQVGYSREDAADCIRYMDAADVAPVRHGRWELEYETYGKMRCSVCKKEALIKKAIGDVGVVTIYVDSNYCPNCGAKMDEGIGNG